MATELSVRNVAILGSSGGGTATLGHTNATSLLSAIHEQLVTCHCRITAACFVALDHGLGMDGANELVVTARLYTVTTAKPLDSHCNLEEPLAVHVSDSAILHEINQQVRPLDQAMAREIRHGTIHGLICISCHTLLFSETLSAAAAAGIAVTGSGGTSLAHAVALYGLVWTGNVGGSVASTTASRAISHTYALASHWQRSYHPFATGTSDCIQWTSVLNACLPAFWGVCLTKRSLQCIQSLGVDHSTMIHDVIFALEHWALPTSCAVILATSDSNQQGLIPTSSLLMASVLASCTCRQTILGGLLAGWLVRQWTHRVLMACIVANLPSTMTSLVSTGLTGGTVAILLLPLAPWLRQVTALVRFIIQWTIVHGPATIEPFVETNTTWFIRSFAAFAWGCLCCYGSKVGWYHAYFPPAILMEMELGEASFLGAVDELTLVLVCAGVCAGICVARLIGSWGHFDFRIANRSDVALCRRGLYINLLCGDFVEVCYPFMERHWLINACGYLAAGLSTSMLVASTTTVELVPTSLAYLPLPLSILLADRQWYHMAMASVVAAGLPFVATLTVCLATMDKQKQT